MARSTPAGRPRKQPDELNELSKSVEGIGEQVASLQKTVEELASQTRGAPARPLAGFGSPLPNAPTSGADRLFAHARRHIPLYAIGAAVVLVLALFPTVEPRDNQGAITGVTQRDGLGDVGSDGQPIVQGADGPTIGGQAAPGGNPGAPTTRVTAGGLPIEAPKIGVGVTRGGFECSAGVRQIPWSLYAAPCVQKFEGNNGGNVYPGVTKDTIKIVERQTQSATGPGVDVALAAAGIADLETQELYRQKFIDGLQKVMETYGRKVVYEVFESNADGTQEGLGGGQEQACADAAYIKNELKAFMVRSAGWVFMDCAAKQGLVVPEAAGYWPESFYKRWHPHAWHLTMDCQTLGYHVGEDMGKTMFGFKARYAGEAILRAKTRHVGWHYPDDDALGGCVELMRDEAAKYCKCDTTGTSVTYPVDLTRMPDAAARSIVTFQAAGVTTVFLGVLFIQTAVMTQQAKQQDYWPEWYLLPVLAGDVDSIARQSYEQDQVHGRLWGLSQVAPDYRYLGKDGEPNRTAKHLFGEDLPQGVYGWYFETIHLFNMIQAAGPVLTPQNMAAGLRALPEAGGSAGGDGTWSLREGNHTQRIDMRHLYWDRNAISKSDGKAGAYIEMFEGNRFRIGQHPSGDITYGPVTGVRTKSVGG